MRRPLPLPHELNPGGFTVLQARALGVSRQRMRGDSLTAPFRGIRTRIDPSNTLELATAYAPKLKAGQLFSHLTAAELLGMRLPEGFRPGPLHISSIPPTRAPRSREIVGHQASLQFPSVTANELPLSSPVDTWLALASELTVDELTIMGDGLVRRVRPSSDIPSLCAAVTRMAGRRGHSRLALALPQIRANTDSARETMLRLLVVRAGYPEPEVNGVIVNSLGAPIAHGDLVYRKYRAVLEYDGGHHRHDERQFNIDVDRLDELMEEEWRVIRVNKSLMHRRATLLGKLETALRRGGWGPEANSFG